MTPRRRGVLVAAFAALLLAGCGKPEAPKVDAATERAQALERAKQDVYGNQVKALEDAKSMGADINKKAQGAIDNAEKSAK
jgi:outer membrane murein-binding lipoprotein Lpp